MFRVRGFRQTRRPIYHESGGSIGLVLARGPALTEITQITVNLCPADGLLDLLWQRSVLHVHHSPGLNDLDVYTFAIQRRDINENLGN